MDPTKPDVRALYKSLRQSGLTDEQARAQLAQYNVPVPSDLGAETSTSSPATSTSSTSSPATSADPGDYPGGEARWQSHLLAAAHILGARFAQWATVKDDEIASAVRVVLSLERALLASAFPQAAITRVEGLRTVPAAPVVRPHPLSLSLQPPVPPSTGQPSDPYPHVAPTDASTGQHTNATPVALPASVQVSGPVLPSLVRHGA